MSPLKTLACSCLLFVLAPAGRLLAADGPVEPYVVYVAREGEFARCGPSEEYYRTDPLRAGAEVEVYLETEDGWLGIRPPAESFCWLQSDQVEVAEDETLGTVIEPSTVAWIGTHLGKARQYRWQVRLDEGEQVTIIGTARREGPEGEEVWYRIVPPPGEFRWLQRSQVCDAVDQVVYGSPATADEPAYAADDKRQQTDVATDRPRAPQRPSDGAPPAEAAEGMAAAESAAAGLAAILDDAPVGSGLARIDDEIQIRSIAQAEEPSGKAEEPSGKAEEPNVKAEETNGAAEQLAAGALPPQPAGAAAAVQPADWVAGSRVVPASALPSSAATLQPTHPPRLQALPEPRVQAPSGYRLSANLDPADLDGLRLELSHAMAAGAHADEVEPLRAHVQRLTTAPSDAVLRGRASLLLRRVEEYQRVAQQRDGQARTPAPLTGTTPPATPSAAASAAASPALSGGGTGSAGTASGGASAVPGHAVPGHGTTFDGQGWLVRVYSARPDAPPYAITDSAGRTLSYITPSAGINLRRYLNQEVGLYGRVAYDTSLETPHLIAEQAVRLRTR